VKTYTPLNALSNTKKRLNSISCS